MSEQTGTLWGLFQVQSWGDEEDELELFLQDESFFLAPYPILDQMSDHQCPRLSPQLSFVFFKNYCTLSCQIHP